VEVEVIEVEVEVEVVEVVVEVYQQAGMEVVVRVEVLVVAKPCGGVCNQSLGARR
jgi:hypothetical protein